jgi:hypothetical protein
MLGGPRVCPRGHPQVSALVLSPSQVPCCQAQKAVSDRPTPTQEGGQVQLITVLPSLDRSHLLAQLGPHSPRERPTPQIPAELKHRRRHLTQEHCTLPCTPHTAPCTPHATPTQSVLSPGLHSFRECEGCSCVRRGAFGCDQRRAHWHPPG